MNAYLPFDAVHLWHIAGWTMIHFLWLGAIVAVVAFLCRLLLRRAAPNVRYAAALGCMIILTTLPLGIAAWLLANSEQSVDVVNEPAVTRRTSDSNTTIIELRENAATSSTTLPVPAPLRVPPLATADSDTVTSESIASMPAETGTLTLAVFAIQSAVPYLPWLWIIGTPITFALLAAGIIGTKRLRRASRTLDDGPVIDLLSQLASSLRITRRVTIAVCDRIAAPVLVGILRPIILLPPAALTGWSPDEIEMVLLHELAHVRRWDNLVNLLQRIIESLLFFHPAVWLVSSWVRREREACCDAAVVARIKRPHAYAELLVALASQLCEPSEPGRPRPRPFLRGRGRPGSLVSAMAAGPLRKRIRRILQLDDDPMLISGKSFAVMLASFVLAATLAILYLPTIGQAEESTTEATENTEPNPEAKVIENDRSEEDWPAGYVFASPRDAEISAGAWQRLYLKLVPATAEELKAASAPHGVRVLNAFPEQLGPNGKKPLILTRVNKVVLRSFDDILKVHEDLNASPEHFVTCTVISDGKEIQLKRERNEAVQPTPARNPVNWPTATEDAAAGVGTHKFPTLEDQKLADLAYKRLGLELEPIGEDDRQRVKALGYEGGLRIAGSSATGPDNRTIQWQWRDVLVGLHVWPTTNLKDVAQVLNRNDLAELYPLKFYVVSNQTVIEPNNSNKPVTKDFVRSARIKVQLDESRGVGTQSRLFDPSRADPGPYQAPPQMRRSEAAPNPFAAPAKPKTAVPNGDAPPYVLPPPEDEAAQAPPPRRRATDDDAPPPPESVERPSQSAEMGFAPALNADPLRPAETGKSALRYDGKSFDEWRDLWKNELSTTKRTDAIKALAAFARAGYGKEATKTILDVAGEYDFNMMSNDAEGKLKTAVLKELIPDSGSDELAKLWLPDLAARLKEDPDKWTGPTWNLMGRFRTDDPRLRAIVESLVANDSPDVRSTALSALIRSTKSFEDGRISFGDQTHKLMTDALKSSEPIMVHAVLEHLYHYPQPGRPGEALKPTLIFQPELVPLLFHDDENLQQRVRGLFHIIDPKDAPKVVEQLTAELQDQTPERRLAAIRAIGAIGPKAEAALPSLKELVNSSSDKKTLLATYAAMEHILREVNTHKGRVFGEAFTESLSEEEKNAVLEKLDYGSPGFLNNIGQENALILPPQSQQLGGGGGFF